MENLTDEERETIAHILLGGFLCFQIDCLDIITSEEIDSSHTFNDGTGILDGVVSYAYDWLID